MANSTTPAVALAPGVALEQFKIVELAGAGAEFFLYVAQREGALFWLSSSPDGNAPFALPPNTETFSARGLSWFAFPLTRLTVAEITRQLTRPELAYWGWRWVALAQSISMAHQRGGVWRAGNAFGLNYLSFSGDGELLFSQGNWDAPAEYAFLPPEGNNAATPVSDVYSLGASLRGVLGASVTPQVRQVLNRATDANPAKRFPEAKTFADALAAALPAPKRAAESKPAKRTPTWLVLGAGALLLLICLVAGAILLPPQLERGLPFAAPAPTAEIAKLSTEIREWQVDENCTARLNVHTQIGDQPPGANEQLRFVVSRAEQPIANVNDVSSSDRADHTLTFSGGNLCELGGEVKLQTQTIGQEVTHILYYYPNTAEEGSLSGIRLGSMQVVTIRHPSLRVYFGFTDLNGIPKKLGGALRVRVRLDGQSVNKFTFGPVDPAQDPLTAALVLDSSGSMKGEAIARAQEAAIQFVENLNPNDRACVYRFATQVELLQDCTTDHAAAIRALKSLEATGGTALYDALTQVSSAHTGKPERQAIIVLSDGDDTTSQSKLEQALEQSTRANVPLYTIGLVNKDLQPDILRKLAESNGGTYLEAPTPAQLAELYAKINAGLANQYQVDFVSPFPERKSGMVEISISDNTDDITFSRSFIVE